MKHWGRSGGTSNDPAFKKGRRTNRAVDVENNPHSLVGRTGRMTWCIAIHFDPRARVTSPCILRRRVPCLREWAADRVFPSRRRMPLCHCLSAAGSPAARTGLVELRVQQRPPISPRRRDQKTSDLFQDTLFAEVTRFSNGSILSVVSSVWQTMFCGPSSQSRLKRVFFVPS